MYDMFNVDNQPNNNFVNDVDNLNDLTKFQNIPKSSDFILYLYIIHARANTETLYLVAIFPICTIIALRRVV